MYTHIHVKKVKETETGGKPTFLDEPVMCKKYYNSFQVDGLDPLKNKHVVEKKLEPNTAFENSVQHAKEKVEEEWMEKPPENEILF